MSLIPVKYNKYLKFFIFIIKYRNSDLFLSMDERFAPEEIHVDELDPSPEELVDDLRQMGPTYVKLGQLLSTRPDMLPEPYLKALANLQDEGEVISYEEVEEILKEEIGARISKAFDYFNPEPMASASIGQVHEARLPSGKKVAVKIQRPHVREQIVQDLDVLMTLSEKAEQYSETARKFSLHSFIEEVKYILLQELDYVQEARNLQLLKENMREFEHLFVPEPITDYYSQRVLTMEYVDGQKVTSISPMVLMDLPREALVEDFLKGYLKQIVVDGFAHADPHPGNVQITRDRKLALIDLGMVARFSEEMQDQILKILLSLSNFDDHRLSDLLLEMSQYDEETAQVENFRRMVARRMQENKNAKASDLQTGKLILLTNQMAAQNNIKLPVELSVLGKILLNMDQIVAFLSPNHDLQKTIRRYMEELMRTKSVQKLKAGRMLETLLESKELLENLPYRLNKISENLADNKVKIKVDAFDEHRFIVAFQKVANRITIGLIIAALILGAALLMRIPTSWTLWGYPGFGIILFLFAASIGLYLIYRIAFTDEPEKHQNQ